MTDLLVYITNSKEVAEGIAKHPQICHHDLESRLGIEPEEKRFLKCKECKYNGDGREKCSDYEHSRIYISQEPIWP